MRQCGEAVSTLWRSNSTQLELAQKLFEREAEVLEEIGSQHDQIPDLYAFFELNVPGLQPGKQDRFYLVQEFIDGKPGRGTS